jgi:D-serine deaminase-like pyridoxal phosphate-dependent protein
MAKLNLTQPTLLLNESICRANINRMAVKIKEGQQFFRPHFKTHQSAEIGNWFKEEGVTAITVSSLQMAIYFADNGWDDITIAMPAYRQQIDQVNQLAARINLQLLFEDLETLRYFEEHCSNPVGVFLKVDTGYHRTGIDADNFDAIMPLLNFLKDCRHLIFFGFLTHAGNTYKANTTAEIETIKQDSIRKLLALKTFLKADFPLLQVSYGDTPSCSICQDFWGIDELRPGNFVFYDWMQVKLGACSIDDIAVALACPVIAFHPERRELVVHGGAVHLSKEKLTTTNGDSYGVACTLNTNGWNVTEVIGHVKALSQEHGIITLKNENSSTFKPGDFIAILPIHSCLTAHSMGKYLTMDGKTIKMMHF